MQKLTFINKVHKLAMMAQQYCPSVNIDKAIQSTLGSAGRLPSVNVETFMTINFGYTKDSFTEPRSKSTELRNEAVSLMSKPGIMNVDYKILSKATDLALDMMGLKRQTFRPCSVHEAADSLPTNTSTGAWWFKTPKSEYKDEAMRACNSIIWNRDFGHIITTTIAVIAWRTQERLSGTKFRQIYVLNYVFNIFEAMFAHPLLKFFEINRDTAYSFNSVWLDNKKIWSKLQRSPNSFALDYSKFDLSMSRGLIVWSLHTIKSLFKLDPVMASLFDAIIVVHQSCPVVTQFNNKPVIFNKQAGMLSGSVFTNLLDSLMNLIMINYALLANGYNPRAELIKVKGDDTIMSNYQNIDLKQIIKTIKDCFGATISEQATKIFKPGEMIEYLGYKFDNRKKLAFSDELLIRKIAISGRFIPEEQMPESLRVVSKIVSVLSNVSNGYYLFNKYFKDRILEYYRLTELPKYYHDLSETETQSYSLTNVKNVIHELKYGWMYK